jgi:2-oxoglutarate ferredoxin oxidoreductase subunit alpha
VLSDLDLGMNLWMTKPLAYPEQGFDRGKVLGAAELDAAESWGRYRDVDSDGIPYRTLPGTEHLSAGYFTRGSGHDEKALYSENPDVYRNNLDRLSRKFDTARTAVPKPVIEEGDNPVGLIAYGTTHHAIVEARAQLREAGIETDYLRVRALPFTADVLGFIERHERVYVVEQNRDGQLFGILRTELPAHAIARLRSVRHYNGVPIDASAIFEPLLQSERTELVPA